MKAVYPVSRYLLGLDVALRNTGVFVWDSHRLEVAHVEVISTEALDGYVVESHVANVKTLCAKLDRVLAFYTPSHAYAELPSGGAKSNRAAVMMSLAIGSVVSLLLCRRVRLVPVKPSDVKHLVRDKGVVDKTEVRDFLIEKHGIEFAASVKPASKQEHVYDAAGAIWAKRILLP